MGFKDLGGILGLNLNQIEEEKMYYDSSYLTAPPQSYGPILKLRGLVPWIFTMGEIGCTTRI